MRFGRSSRSRPADGHGDMIRVTRKARSSAPSAAEPIDLGKRLKLLRTQRAWTLANAAENTGLARSTLSKIENRQMSPTFEVLQKIARGFGVDIADLFSSEHPQSASGRRSITRKGAGRRHVTSTHQHELLNADLASKRMLPFRSSITARTLDASGGWMHHDGEEFAYILKGKARVYSEHYEPVDLNPGDSIYLDGKMGHAFISIGPTDAVALWVVTA
ncbi:MAG: helix-turn-helix transcriptional regulator [Rhodospirillales bacterium]|nr:helix-turn-helix transcriptional regulator [Rhodospirillales bacterium]